MGYLDAHSQIRPIINNGHGLVYHIYVRTTVSEALKKESEAGVSASSANIERTTRF